MLETNHTEILKRIHEQDHLGRSSGEITSFNAAKNSGISTKLLSGVKAGSNLIASVVPSSISSAREWASNLSTSAPSFRFSHRSGFHDLKNDSTCHTTKDSEKIYL